MVDMVGFDVAGEGMVQVRIAKLTHIDDTLVERAYHRINLPPGHDIDEAMAAVNANLADMGYSAVGEADISLIKANADVQWTPERIAAYQAKLEAQAAADEAARLAAEQEAADAAAAQQAELDAQIAAAVQEALANQGGAGA